jgi:D-tyrosyl-tRNA(Tyr) deacylase
VKAVVTRVSSARVLVDGDVIAALDQSGLLVLLGIGIDDTADKAATMARKLHESRILREEKSCAETGSPLLVVSQFTLYGNTRKGRRPSWTDAASPAIAEPLINSVVENLRSQGAIVKTGVFGANMAVQSVNDGPFTVIVEV